MNIRDAEDVQNLREELELKIVAYLRQNGWEYTCSTPGSLWLWSRTYKGKTILVDQTHALAMQRAFESGVYSK